MSDIERAMRAAREEREARRRETAARRAESGRKGRAHRRPDDAPLVSGSPAALGGMPGGGGQDDRSSEAAGADSPDRANEPRVRLVPVRPPRSEAAARGAKRTDGRRESAPGRSIELPLERLAGEGLITPGMRKGRLSEEFRRIKRPIIRNVVEGAVGDGHPNIVAVTSSVSGEGKTYTAINLAMSLATERERTVLLIDADVLKGTAGRTLGVEEDVPGLTDLLSDESIDLADVILSTDVPDLRFLPAGRSADEATELLSSVRMKTLVDELAVRYADRIVVLDCPPMLQTNEANVIVEHAGQIVFVVAGQETNQNLVLEAMRRFDERKSVGILLNKARARGADYGYDYGYGHG